MLMLALAWARPSGSQAAKLIRNLWIGEGGVRRPQAEQTELRGTRHCFQANKNFAEASSSLLELFIGALRSF